MQEMRHEEKVQNLREDQHGDGDFDRRFDVLLGVISGREHFDGNEPQQTAAVAHQRQRHLLHIRALESAVVIEHGHQRRRKAQQRHGSRHCEQHDQPQPPVDHGGEFRAVAAGLGRCQLRHQHNAQSHAEHRSGKLHEPIGKAEPTDGAGLQM